MLAAKLLGACGGEEKLYVDDVFSAYTYTGNGSTQTINNGIDLAGKGGMVWAKNRSDAYNHSLIDTARGANKTLISNTTNAQFTRADSITSFNSNGFTLGTDASGNGTNFASGQSLVSWTFRKAPKFFLNTTVIKSSGSNATIDLSSLGTVGMVMVKRTDAAGSWYVWHRSATAGKLLYLEQTAAEATLGHITVSGTTLTLVNGVIADGSYVVYAWAHDSSADGIVQCGSFTTDGSGNATVNLGWEPQYLMVKNSQGAGHWNVVDTSRAFTSGSNSSQLQPNNSNAESGSAAISANASGFSCSLAASNTHVYLAIRRPNKPPTLGTQVYNAIARTGTGAAATVTGVGFAPDLFLAKDRLSATDGIISFTDRLRGATKVLYSTGTYAEESGTLPIASLDMDGYSLTSGLFPNRAITYINHFFKRAVGVFDQVCYTGTGVAKTEVHGLGVVPELMIVKKRSAASGWSVGGPTILTTTGVVFLNTTAAKDTSATGAWNSTAPTATVFSLGAALDVNASAATFVAYLFATKAGISKVFSFTGNGGTQNIDCGFTTGARFVLIKATSTTGNWNLGDSTRGIVAAADPFLCLNTTAAEVTSDDWLDPYAQGFTVNETAAAHANTNGVTYIGLAFS